jgi:hypothetical protein
MVLNRKVIAIVMVCLMTFAVFGTLTATAQSGSTTKCTTTGQLTITWPVIIGQKATFTQKWFNVHGTSFIAPSGSASSKLGNIYAFKDHTSADAAKGASYAWVGVKFRVLGYKSWSEAQTRSVVITVKGPYDLHATSTPGNAWADLQIGTGSDPLNPSTITPVVSITTPPYDPNDPLHDHDTFANAAGTLQTTTYTFTLSQLSTGKPGECEVFVLVSANAAYAGTGGLGANLLSTASANATLESLQIAWA